MQHEDALALVAGSYCLHVNTIMPSTLRKVKVVPSVIQDNELTTWMVKGGHFFTLIQTSNGTKVYDHTMDCLFYASPNVEIAKECPEGHAFLVQTVVDKEGENFVPRLLVMDLVQPVIPSPVQRGEIIRNLSRFFSHICHVQWAGDKRHLEDFLRKGLPHEVDCIVALREPLCLVREGGGLACYMSID